QRCCHLDSICCGWYSATRGYSLLRGFFAPLDLAEDFFGLRTGLERRALRKAAATFFVRARLGILRRATFFFAAAVSIEKPFSGAGASCFRPARSQSAATLRRSSPGSSIGVSARKARPGRPSGTVAVSLGCV